MKKTIILIIATITFGCSNDREQQEQSIYGKWYYNETIINNISFPYDDHETCGKDYIEFYDQDKIRSVDIWNCTEEVDWVGAFSKSFNNLIISNGTESRTVEIVELNSNSLAYEYDYDEDDDGIDEHHIEKFTRQ